MNFNQAMTIFKNHFPKLTILKCVDYSNTHYVLEAVENPEITSYNSPYYAVDKNNGNVTSFIPTLDLDAFFDAVENRTVYSTY